MKYSLFVLLLLFLVGCNHPQSESSQQEAVDSTVTFETLKEEIFPFPDSFAPTIGNSERPDSAQSFRAEFIRRFESDLYSPFLDLGYWENSNDEQIEHYLTDVLQSFTLPPNTNRGVIHNAKRGVKIQTLARYGDWAYYPREGDNSIELSPEPSHVLGVEAHISDSTSLTQYFAVGSKDGKFYFCTIANN